MPGLQLPFSKAEYDRRLEKVRAAMQAAEIDLLFIEDPSNMAWLTGYDGWSFYVHQGVLVFLDADPLWWGRSQDANGARRTVWMSDDNVAWYPDHFVQSTLCHPMEVLAALIRDRGKRAAAEGDGRGHVDVRVTGAWTDWIEGRGHGGETWQDRARRKSREARAAHAARHRRR